MSFKKDIRVGIGFATGRSSFQKILRTNIYNWKECGLTDQERISLNLFVAYDLKYTKTKVTDYTNINPQLLDLIDKAYFIHSSLIHAEMEELIGKDVISPLEARLFFTDGYAAKRNSIQYLALKKRIDYLLFLDDDEYPMAVTNSKTTALWGGQHILHTHLKYIVEADITNGHHCGYISPIPHIEYNDVLTEDDFRVFIEAISNDIVNWDTIRTIMKNGGVTYADKEILISEAAEVVQEIGGAKFISGSNLCINLTRPERTHPFYNPPKARGEDTFLSTCLTNNLVIRVPCYAFHDAFSFYKPLMDGVLPIALKHIKTEASSVVSRFYKACIGWVRYKPLFMYITQPDNFESIIVEMRKDLAATLPKLCAYFEESGFMKIQDELNYYYRNVKNHHQDFLRTQNIWSKIQQYLSNVY